MGKTGGVFSIRRYVLFDSTCGVLPDDSKEKLKNILTDDEYNAITKTQYVYRFKYHEISK